LAFRLITSGGGASRSQPLRIPGQGFYLGERKLAVPTCRDEVAEVLEGFTAGRGGRVFTVGEVYAAMVAEGTSWSRETVVKTMVRMTLPVRRPPFVQLERVAINRYRVLGMGPGVASPQVGEVPDRGSGGSVGVLSG
jgi:hypothetical protein